MFAIKNKLLDWCYYFVRVSSDYSFLQAIKVFFKHLYWYVYSKEKLKKQSILK